MAAAADPGLAREIEASQPDAPRGGLQLNGVANLLDEPPVVQDARASARRRGCRRSAARSGGRARSAAIAQVVDGHEHEAVMKRAGYVYEAAFPMLARGRVHGMISFWRPQQRAARSTAGC